MATKKKSRKPVDPAPRRRSGKAKGKKKAREGQVSATKKKPKGKARKVAGFCFSSPMVIFLFGQNAPNAPRLTLINDEMTRRDVRSNLANRNKRSNNVYIVAGVRNLYKLGPKAKSDIRVVVHDAPEVLHALRATIKVIDAVQDEEGIWFLKDPRPTIQDIRDAINGSGYRPTHPDKVKAMANDAVAVVPTYDKGFQPGDALDALFGAVKEDYRETVQSAIFRFMAGLTDRRSIGGARRSAATHLKGGKRGSKAEADFRKLWSNVQAWIEDDAEGRLVSSAYQILAGRKVRAAALAAARVNCDLAMLNRLTRFIPPSRNLDFSGWKFNPKRV
jgi:hypothetical protein